MENLSGAILFIRENKRIEYEHVNGVNGRQLLIYFDYDPEVHNGISVQIKVTYLPPWEKLGYNAGFEVCVTLYSSSAYYTTQDLVASMTLAGFLQNTENRVIEKNGVFVRNFYAEHISDELCCLVRYLMTGKGRPNYILTPAQVKQVDENYRRIVSGITWTLCTALLSNTQ